MVAAVNRAEPDHHQYPSRHHVLLAPMSASGFFGPVRLGTNRSCWLFIVCCNTSWIVRISCTHQGVHMMTAAYLKTPSPKTLAQKGHTIAEAHPYLVAA